MSRFIAEVIAGYSRINRGKPFKAIH